MAAVDALAASLLPRSRHPAAAAILGLVTLLVVSASADAALETGSITGRVTGPDHAGIAGVQALAYVPAGGFSFTLVSTAQTDESGDYAITGLADGSYRVCFSPDDATYFQYWCYDDAGPWPGGGTEILVTGGGATTGINEQLQEIGGIAGRVTGPDGNGVSGIMANFYTWRDYGGGYGSWTSWGAAPTDESGSYELKGMPGGTYRVCFEDTHNVTTLPEECYENARNVSEATDVEVTVGAITPGINAQLGPTGLIAGTVTNEQGEPIISALARFLIFDGADWIFSSAAHTDAEGRYESGELQAASYRVCFLDTAGAYAHECYDDAPFREYAADIPMALVPVTAGETVSEIDAQLAPAGSITGTVTDRLGNPLHEVQVAPQVCNAAGSFCWGVGWTSTADDGTYHLKGLQTGSYTVQFVLAHNSEALTAVVENIAVVEGATTSGIDAQFDVIQGATSPGLSCTTNTLGLPLDSSACFYDGSDNWRKAILKKAGVVVAEASVVGNQGGFCANNLLWQDASGMPISDWSGLFAGADTAAVEISAERPDGSTVVLGTRTASRSQFDVTVTANQTFPMSGPHAEADFTATPAGGTGPYTYQWTEVFDYLLGYGHNDWGSSATTSIELPTYGEKYLTYPARWGSASSLHPINLRVTDSAGQVATVECLAAVTVPFLNGDPSLSGSGSQLLRGVDVATGNYHRSTTDLSVSGKGPDFTVTRAYNANGAKIGAWTFNLDMRLGLGSMARELAIGPREDGRYPRYYRELDGSWRSLNPGNFDELAENADGTFTLYTQGNLLYRFADPEGGAAGRLETIEDRDGNVLSFSHTDNRITGATDASGRSYTVTRDASGRITRVSDFTGRDVEYTWNADYMITAVRNPRGKSITYGYRAGSSAAERSKLASITDARNNVQATIAYYSSGSLEGKVESVTDGAGNEWGFVHGVEDGTGAAQSGVTRPAVNGVNNNIVFILDDARTRVVERVDSINVGDYRSRTTYKTTTQRTRIPELALPVETYRPSDAKTTIAYTQDGRGNPATITDPLDRETAATWAEVAGQNNLTPLASVQSPGVPTPTRYSDFTPSGKAETVIDPLGQTTARDFDGDGLLLQTTDARGNSTDIEYDTAGRPVRATDALGHVTATSYDDLGRVLTQTNARGYTTRFTYDANGNRLTTTNPAGGVTTNVYDASDNLVSTTDPRGNTTTFVYDAFNRKMEERYTVGGQQRLRGFAYDAMGRLYRVTNEKGHNSDTHFDARGKVLQEINPLSQTITYTYDANGNVLTVTDAEGRTITNNYDALDRKTRVTDTLGNFEEYSYNDQGLLASKTDPRGQVTRYEYDALGQMTKVIDASGGETLAGYDANGNLASTTDPNGHTTTYSYDAADRLTQLTDAEGRQWIFTYDANGNRLTQTTPSGQTTSYSYDSLDRVTSVSYPGGPTVGYTYDANGNRKTMTDANGTTQYSYDERNRLTTVTDAFGNTVAYGYDAAGLMDRLTYPGNRRVDFTHDAAGRLASLTDWLNDTTTYTRDESGAVKTIQYGNGARVEKVYDSGGRLTSLVNHNAANGVISSHTLTLDGLGNPLSAELDLPLEPANLGRSAVHLYDASNRLTSVAGTGIGHDDDGRLVADRSGSTAIQYAYNAQDLITQVTQGGLLTDTYTYDGDGRRVAHTQDGQTTRFVIDPTGGDLYSVLAETDGANNVQHYYLYGESLVAQITGNSHRYYHFDQTGNTLALTDDSGMVTDRYAYEPFGNTTVQGSSDNPFRFVGKYGVMDDGNGLIHMRARYYRADLGRFLSLDRLYGAMADPITLNRYQYVGGNPAIGIDPNGLFIREAYDFCNEYTANLCWAIGKSTADLKTPYDVIASHWVHTYEDYVKRFEMTVDAYKNGHINRYEASALLVGNYSITASDFIVGMAFTTYTQSAVDESIDLFVTDPETADDLHTANELVHLLVGINGAIQNLSKYNAAGEKLRATSAVFKELDFTDASQLLSSQLTRIANLSDIQRVNYVATIKALHDSLRNLEKKFLE